MPMSRSSMTKTGVCSRSARSKASAEKAEALVRVGGQEHHVLGVAVRGVGGGQEIRLLRPRRHAGRGAAALDVEDHRRDLGEIGEAEELLHQRDAGTGRGGEGAGAVPCRADHHADRGELVLGLDDRVAVLAGDRIDAVAGAVLAEGLRQRGRGRDRIPRRDGRPAIDGAEPGGVVALDEDAVADRIGAADRGGRSARRSRGHGRGPC